VKKEKILSISILWASLIVATALLNHHMKHVGFTFMLLLICCGASAAIMDTSGGRERDAIPCAGKGMSRHKK
jgi:hypothetical protein